MPPTLETRSEAKRRKKLASGILEQLDPGATKRAEDQAFSDSLLVGRAARNQRTIQQQRREDKVPPPAVQASDLALVAKRRAAANLKTESRKTPKGQRLNAIDLVRSGDATIRSSALGQGGGAAGIAGTPKDPTTRRVVPNEPATRRRPTLNDRLAGIDMSPAALARDTVRRLERKEKRGRSLTDTEQSKLDQARQTAREAVLDNQARNVRRKGTSDVGAQQAKGRRERFDKGIDGKPVTPAEERIFDTEGGGVLGETAIRRKRSASDQERAGLLEDVAGQLRGKRQGATDQEREKDLTGRIEAVEGILEQLNQENGVQQAGATPGQTAAPPAPVPPFGGFQPAALPLQARQNVAQAPVAPQQTPSDPEPFPFDVRSAPRRSEAIESRINQIRQTAQERLGQIEGERSALRAPQPVAEPVDRFAGLGPLDRAKAENLEAKTRTELKKAAEGGDLQPVLDSYDKELGQLMDAFVATVKAQSVLSGAEKLTLADFEKMPRVVEIRAQQKRLRNVMEVGTGRSERFIVATEVVKEAHPEWPADRVMEAAKALVTKMAGS